jgi:putative aminopeptidase FrvX
VKVIGRLQIDTNGVIVGSIVSKGSIRVENVGDFMGVPTDRFCRAMGRKERVIMRHLHGKG